MKRIHRDQHLTPEQAAKQQTIREQVAAELPDLINRHHERLETFEQWKEARDANGATPGVGESA